jgi:hypothetical protein
LKSHIGFHLSHCTIEAGVQGGERMTDELISIQVMLVTDAAADRELFRRAASASKIPIEVIEADGAVAASRPIAAGVDLTVIAATVPRKIRRCEYGARGFA